MSALASNATADVQQLFNLTRSGFENQDALRGAALAGLDGALGKEFADTRAEFNSKLDHVLGAAVATTAELGSSNNQLRHMVENSDRKRNAEYELTDENSKKRYAVMEGRQDNMEAKVDIIFALLKKHFS